MGFSGVKSFSEQSPPSCLLAFKLPPDAPFPFPRTCKYQLVEMSTIKNCNLDQLFISHREYSLIVNTHHTFDTGATSSIHHMIPILQRATG